MNNQSPTAQSGPSDRAIAQAFREYHTAENYRNKTCSFGNVVARAREIDATTPPAGARDAVPDAYERGGRLMRTLMEAEKTQFYGDGPIFPLYRHPPIAALTGKTDGGDAVGYIDEIPDDGVCIPGRIARWYGPIPLAGTKLYTQPAATGAGEGRWAPKEPTPNMLVDLCKGADYGWKSAYDRMWSGLPQSETNTAATGMGDGRAETPTTELRRLVTRWRALAATWADIFPDRKYRMETCANELEVALAAQPAPVVGVTPEMVQDVFYRLPVQLNAKGRHEFFAERLNEPLLSARPGGEGDFVDIANRAQEVTGRSIWPSTVKAVLEAANYYGLPVATVSEDNGGGSSLNWTNGAHAFYRDHPPGTKLYAHPAQAGGGRE